MDPQVERYMQMAQQAKLRAYAPYSHFRVGAVAVDAQGHAYPGCNIENAAYSCCMCAERTALYSALAQGAERIEAIYFLNILIRTLLTAALCMLLGPLESRIVRGRGARYRRTSAKREVKSF